MTTAVGPGGPRNPTRTSQDSAVSASRHSDRDDTAAAHRRGSAGDGQPDERTAVLTEHQPGDSRPRPDRWKSYFGPRGNLRPFRLLKQDLVNIKGRYVSDWLVFNQHVVASSVYIFFTNILPGITFASDLYNLTGKSWGTIEIVFSTGLCGIIFAL